MLWANRHSFLLLVEEISLEDKLRTFIKIKNTHILWSIKYITQISHAKYIYIYIYLYIYIHTQGSLLKKSVNNSKRRNTLYACHSGKCLNKFCTLLSYSKNVPDLYVPNKKFFGYMHTLFIALCFVVLWRYSFIEIKGLW